MNKQTFVSSWPLRSCHLRFSYSSCATRSLRASSSARMLRARSRSGSTRTRVGALDELVSSSRDRFTCASDLRGSHRGRTSCACIAIQYDLFPIPASDSESDFITTGNWHTENLLRPIIMGYAMKNADVITVVLDQLPRTPHGYARRLILCDPSQPSSK
jgi:hypothetical protein